MTILPEQISRYMSLREPQLEALEVLHAISADTDYKTAAATAVAAKASAVSKTAKPVEFDTKFPSFCFALATGVGKTRLMGASIYYLWKNKGYKNFFILAPNITIYDKLRAELNPAHAKYMFVGLSDFPSPEIYDGDNYLRFNPRQGRLDDNQANVFIFNISKIFSRTDVEFKFHRFNETLGDSFSAMLREMDDLVFLMDESHRYRGPKSLEAINHLKPALGIEFTATPTYEKNVVYSFGLAQAIGKFVKSPTVITRTNLTTADEAELEKLKLLDGMTLHEMKKARLAEYCAVKQEPLVKPFVLISTKDTTHASEVRNYIESDAFCDGRYKGKVIEIHSGKTGAESDENIQRLLSVESATSTVEIVVHVNMLKEGWDVRNLYTIIPLRASTSEILTEQTIGRGLRLPFGKPTGDADLDALEIISHEQYAKLIKEAQGNPLFTIKRLEPQDLRPVTTVPVTHKFIDMDKVLDIVREQKSILFTSELTDKQKLNEVVEQVVAAEAKQHEQKAAAEAAHPGTPATVQDALFPQEVAKPFDPVARKEELKTTLLNYAHASIDVPQLEVETVSSLKLEPFDVKVNSGPFELVDQRILARELSSGKERIGEQVAVMEVDNPRAFLAGQLIDAVDEIDVTNDKAAVLAIVDKYLAQINKPAGELGKIVHLYRETIIRDLKEQVEAHITDNTKSEFYVKNGFVKFRDYAKSVLAKDGIVPYTTAVQRSDVGRYLFEGFKKSFYPRVPFDSTPEKDFAAVLERDTAVLKWVRPPEGNIPIRYKGQQYNPDFIVETADKKYMIEIKAHNELSPTMDQTVHDKALAALRWCETASSLKGSKPWEYKLIPDNAVEPTHDLKLILSCAVKVVG
ncbi:MAG: DEAD/DEAH box helicase family protein [Elusimicrobiales bacterium]|nr:DEAD/DEAH box helicase family protein [Elusimicrobiales bacterium]